MSIHPAPSAKPPPRQRILVMRYRFIGDTLLTVPFLRNLRAAYPHAIIDVLAAPNSGELLRDCPYINELIMFDTTRKHRYENSDQPTRSFWSYVRLLREKRYDTAFVLKRSFSSAALAALAGIPERIGFGTEGRGWLLTQRVPYRKDAPESDCFLDVLQAAGVPVRDRHLESWNRPEDEQASEKHLPKSASHNIVLHLSSSNRAKQWSETHALQLAEQLLNEPGCHLHALGAASDALLYESLREKLPAALRDRLHLHCGQLSLPESMAFLRRMDLVVGVDSGTLHMASAAGVPVIALFGPMNEHKWGPLNAEIITEAVACRPCNLETPCKFKFQCMSQLQPDTVMARIRERLHTHARFA